MRLMSRLTVAFAALLPLQSVMAEEVHFPIQVVDAQGDVTVATGIFRNNPRRDQRQQQQGQPAPGERTQPVDPNATPPLNGGSVAVEGASGAGGFTVNVELTPEQKQQIFGAVISFITALLAVVAGTGKAPPFLTYILNLFKNAPPLPAPAKTKARVRKPKAPPTT